MRAASEPSLAEGGIQEHCFGNDAIGEALEGRAGKNAVGSAGINLLGAAQLDEGFGAVAEGTGGIHHIIHQHYGLAVNIADDIHDLADIGAGTALINDGQGQSSRSANLRARVTEPIGETTAISSRGGS